MALWIAVAKRLRIVVGYVMRLFPSRSRKGRKKFILIPNIECIVSWYFKLFFRYQTDNLKEWQSSVWRKGSSCGLCEQLSEARKPESLGKISYWDGVGQLFWWHSRWPRSGFWIVDKHGKLLLWSSSFMTVLECYKMAMVKPWNIWGCGTSTKERAVQAAKEDHGKNDLGKNDVERFTRMQQNLIPIWCFQFIFVSVVPYKSPSQQLLQPFILFFFYQ